MPENLVRNRRSLAVAVVVALVGVPAAVLLSAPTPTAFAAAAPGSTVRASVADGTNAESQDGGWKPELSADGNSIVFTSTARLDPIEIGPLESMNVYVRDLRNDRTVQISRGQFTRLPEPEPTPVPTPVPTPPTYTPPKLGAEPLLSLNGRRAQPPGGPGVEYGEVEPDGISYSPTISGDGRYVAFATTATNLTLADADDSTDLLVCDRDPDGDGEFDEEREEGGVDYEYFRVSQPVYQEGEGGPYRADAPALPKLSDDASRIVWQDRIYDTQGVLRVVARTASLVAVPGGAVGAPATVAVVPMTHPTGVFQRLLEPPDVSGDGRYVVAAAEYYRNEGAVEFPTRVYFHAVMRVDLVTGVVTRVDLDEATLPDEPVYLGVDRSVVLASPSISSGGGEIVFSAEAYLDYCDPGDCWYSAADQPQVFVVRVEEDGTPIDSVISSRGNDNQIVNGILPSLSGDGRFLAFVTDNPNAHDGVDGEGGESCIVPPSEGLSFAPDANIAALPPADEQRDERTTCQVVVRDLVVDRVRLSNEDPWLTGTLASPGTSDDCADEVPDDGTCGGNGATVTDRYSEPPTLSNDGARIGYDSEATDLLRDVPDENERTDVYVRTFQPELRADPNPLQFGDVELEDTFDQTVRLDHVGAGPLVVTEVEVVGANADDFVRGAQTCAGEAVVLQRTDSCEVAIAFTPTAEGDRSATLRLQTRDGREFTVDLRGRGTKEPVPNPDARFAAGPDPLGFGSRLQRSTGPEPAVTVRNTGEGVLRITEVQIRSETALNDYAIVTDTCTGVAVPAGGQCQVTLRFIPTAEGERPAVLRFVDNAPGSAHLVTLTGAGIAPTVELSRAVIQPGRVVTVTGQGFPPLQNVTVGIPDSTATTKATTNAQGGFVQDVLILPKSPVGNRPMVATVDAFPGITAQKPLLIVTPSVSPAEFVVRG